MFYDATETNANVSNVSTYRKKTSTNGQFSSTKKRSKKSSPTQTRRSSQFIDQQPKQSNSLSSNRIKLSEKTFKNHYSLSCLYTNSTSLNPEKLAELSIRAQQKSAHIIFVAETWFNETSSINIDNYSVHCNNRNKLIDGKAKRGGGVAIYMHKSLDVSDIYDISLRNLYEHKHSEQIWREVGTGTERILVGCIYRPPTYCKIDSLSASYAENEIISAIKTSSTAVRAKKYHGLILCGDFNYPKLKWDEFGNISCQSVYQPEGHEFAETVNNFYLHQHVFQATNFDSNFRPLNTLDLIITEDANRIDTVEHNSPLGPAIQSHSVLSFKFWLAQEIKTRISNKRHNFKKGNYKKIIEKASEIDWNSLFFNAPDVESAYSLFLNDYKRICDEHITILIPRLPKKRAPLVSKELISLSNKKHELWH